jgi:hypothetical protein
MMNERIKQLAEQAGLTDYMVFGRIESKEDVLRNFAESIIKECAGLVEDYYDEDTKYLAGHIIRKHFGIK